MRKFRIMIGLSIILICISAVYLHGCGNKIVTHVDLTLLGAAE